MEYSGGYFLLSTASANQAYYLKPVVNGGFYVEKLISVDEKVGGVFPNLSFVWRKSSQPAGTGYSLATTLRGMNWVGVSFLSWVMTCSRITWLLILTFPSINSVCFQSSKQLKS
ncbi:hypothetical protein B0H99_10361 [Planomicrobium soli]|uniref:Uncharacterized protein n=1 Tax=Planomicrobium soli TaxID=1176648 RepID=A0A2P8H401_9BACL|nr:hypothetical protein B0H99_10361 [Planomicrobium soli]